MSCAMARSCARVSSMYSRTALGTPHSGSCSLRPMSVMFPRFRKMSARKLNIISSTLPDARCARRSRSCSSMSSASYERWPSPGYTPTLHTLLASSSSSEDEPSSTLDGDDALAVLCDPGALWCLPPRSSARILAACSSSSASMRCASAMNSSYDLASSSAVWTAARRSLCSLRRDHRSRLRRRYSMYSAKPARRYAAARYGGARLSAAARFPAAARIWAVRAR